MEEFWMARFEVLVYCENLCLISCFHQFHGLHLSTLGLRAFYLLGQRSLSEVEGNAYSSSDVNQICSSEVNVGFNGC